MTSKEFIRRRQAFAPLISAYYFFAQNSYQLCGYIFICTTLSRSLEKIVHFIPDLDVPVTSVPHSDVDTLIIERYSYSQFQIDCKYFLSFVNKLTTYQRDSLFNDADFLHLFIFLNDSNK